MGEWRELPNLFIPGGIFQMEKKKWLQVLEE